MREKATAETARDDAQGALNTLNTQVSTLTAADEDFDLDAAKTAFIQLVGLGDSTTSDQDAAWSAFRSNVMPIANADEGNGGNEGEGNGENADEGNGGNEGEGNGGNADEGNGGNADEGN